MALSTNYLITTKNLDSFINSLLSAQAPDKFTNKFLTDLGFTSSNDRLYLGLLKSLGLLDDNSAPTQKYYEFLDETKYRIVLADCIKESYSDLFNINKNADKMDVKDVKNKFKTLTQGKKTEKVLSLMASTFKSLCDIADFSTQSNSIEVIDNKVKPETTNDTLEREISNLNTDNYNAQLDASLHYDIHIHLPETRDDAVYDAIFKSIKRNLYK